MTNETFRPLETREAGLIEKMLAADFPGKDEIASQVATALVRKIDGNGSLEFLVRDTTKASVKRRVPIEAEAHDADGITIHILLHVVEGIVSEFEVYKDDGSDVVAIPGPEDLDIVLND
jgi:hypothetical protein